MSGKKILTRPPVFLRFGASLTIDFQMLMKQPSVQPGIAGVRHAAFLQFLVRKSPVPEAFFYSRYYAIKSAILNSLVA
jgi:hypothetical protein